MRGRVKRIEDIDPAIICCEATRGFVAKLEGVEFDTTGQPWMAITTCDSCGRESHLLHWSIIGPTSNFNAVVNGTFDLDEGSHAS